MADGKSLKPMKELSLLKVRDENVEDYDDWPLMELDDAEVFHKNKTDMYDLLEVADHGPFHITGRLRNLDPDFQHIIKNKTVYDRTILIPKVSTWGIERVQDTTDIKIWALGQSGWYSLHPSPAYKKIFRHSMRKATMWLFLEDRYEGMTLKGKWKPNAELISKVFEDLADEKPELGDSEDVENLFNEYRRFFFAKLLEPDGVRKYNRTPLWRYYIVKHKDEFEKMKKQRSEINDDQSDADVAQESSNSQSDGNGSRNKKRKGGKDADNDNDGANSKSRNVRRKKGEGSSKSNATPQEKKGNGKSRSSKGTSILRPSTTVPSASESSPVTESQPLHLPFGDRGSDFDDRLQASPEPVRPPDFSAMELEELSESSSTKRYPVLELFDENAADVNGDSINLRAKAISQLTDLHMRYLECEKDWTACYELYKELYKEVYDWRRKHMLRPIYVDINFVKGGDEFDIDDDVVLESIPNTEYLINLREWSLEIATQHLQDVNRGVHGTDHLQPLAKDRRNVINQPSKISEKKSMPPVRRSKRKGAVKYLRMAVDAAEAKKFLYPIAWKCAGKSANGICCDFVVENSTTEEGNSAVAHHWKTCPLRKEESERALQQRRQLVTQAHRTAVEFQSGEPDANLDNLIQWIESEARRSSKFPIDQF